MVVVVVVVVMVVVVVAAIVVVVTMMVCRWRKRWVRLCGLSYETRGRDNGY